MAPRVSIALPVFNGENFLAAALKSIGAQSFRDFELVITDNASTDRTAEICQEFAAEDSRARYVRLPHNIGAAPNFNRAFAECVGDYFKWAAHDDLLAPDFLARCVEVLDENRDAVLSYPRAIVIDSAGQHVEEYGHKLATDTEDPVERFASLLRGGHKCFEVFGLIRRDVLARTPLMGAYSHGDGVLLARLALRGRFVEIPEPLFFPRRHDGQSMTMLHEWPNETGAGRAIADYREYAVWFDARLKGRRVFPCWRMGLEFFKSFVLAPIPLLGRLRCIKPFLRWMWIYRRMLRGDVSFHVKRLLRPPTPTSS